MNSLKFTDLLAYFLIFQTVQFLWYYSTLPGSIMPPRLKNVQKPSIRSALIKFITYMMPFYIMAYLAYNNKNLLPSIAAKVMRK
uniref:Uncharacterized protein n=1 Tax=viral metagenome TaxID=1070528 RepID=A0A6C0DA21_9ZZZZ